LQGVDASNKEIFKYIVLSCLIACENFNIFQKN